MNSAKPLEWVKKIDTALIELDKAPQFILPSTFPIKEVEAKLRSLFEHPSLILSSQQKGWVSHEDILEGIGEKLRVLKIVWAPISEPAYFVMSIQNLKLLMNDLLNGEESAALFADDEYAEGFYHYLFLEILKQIEITQFAAPLTPRLGGGLEDIEVIIGDGPFFVCDLSMQYAQRNIWGRLLLSKKFRNEWNAYFSTKPPLAISDEVRGQIPVDISLEVGHTRLKFQDWKKVKTGDFIILDHCSYNPREKKGSLSLTLGEKTIFRGRFKKLGIKLLGYPFYEEVNDMEEKFGSDDEEDEDFYEDLDEDLDEDEDENLHDKISRSEEEEEEEDEEEKEFVSSPIEKGHIAIEDLPIRITVEVGRIRMTAKELIDLSPGNLLKLDVNPAQGVNLVINGQKVGSGELIQIGETLGVRILNL